MLENTCETDLRLINPVTFAFLGDSVYELLVREEIIRRYTSLSAGKLHTFTVNLVCATAQVRAYHAIEPFLTEEEKQVFRRGRNTTAVTPPRHTDAGDYRIATGLEALFGWLYLEGRTDRLRELFSVILQNEENSGILQLNDN